MKIDFTKFIYLRVEIIVAGTIIVNLLTQVIKKTNSRIYGSLLAIVSSIIVSTTYLLYFLLYEKYTIPVDYATIIRFMAQIIFEYITHTAILVIYSKVGYDTLKCYWNKIKTILEVKNGKE